MAEYRMHRIGSTVRVVTYNSERYPNSMLPPSRGTGDYTNFTAYVTRISGDKTRNAEIVRLATQDASFGLVVILVKRVSQVQDLVELLQGESRISARGVDMRVGEGRTSQGRCNLMSNALNDAKTGLSVIVMTDNMYTALEPSLMRAEKTIPMRLMFTVATRNPLSAGAATKFLIEFLDSEVVLLVDPHDWSMNTTALMVGDLVDRCESRRVILAKFGNSDLINLPTLTSRKAFREIVKMMPEQAKIPENKPARPEVKSHGRTQAVVRYGEPELNAADRELCMRMGTFNMLGYVSERGQEIQATVCSASTKHIQAKFIGTESTINGVLAHTPVELMVQHANIRDTVHRYLAKELAPATVAKEIRLYYLEGSQCYDDVYTVSVPGEAFPLYIHIQLDFVPPALELKPGQAAFVYTLDGAKTPNDVSGSGAWAFGIWQGPQAGTGKHGVVGNRKRFTHAIPISAPVLSYLTKCDDALRTMDCDMLSIIKSVDNKAKRSHGWKL